MISVTRKLHFDAAHRVLEHESKCKYLHGHRYVVEVTVTANKLDKLGRVVDFGVIKEKLGSWIDNNWDHNVILNIADKELGLYIEKVTKQKVFYLEANPTAENIASFLFNKIIPDLFSDYNIKCTQVRVHETPNCFTDYYG